MKIPRIGTDFPRFQPGSISTSNPILGVAKATNIPDTVCYLVAGALLKMDRPGFVWSDLNYWEVQAIAYCLIETEDGVDDWRFLISALAWALSEGTPTHDFLPSLEPVVSHLEGMSVMFTSQFQGGLFPRNR